MNTNYPQILLCALALEHKVDLISFFCATEGQAALNPVIGLMNEGLHPDLPVIAMDMEPSSDMHDVFCDQWPELIVMLPVGNAPGADTPIKAAVCPVAYWGVGMGNSPAIKDIDKN